MADEPCNDIPTGPVTIQYPTADQDVTVECPKALVQVVNNYDADSTPIFVRFVVDTTSAFAAPLYDSALLAVPVAGTFEHQIAVAGTGVLQPDTGYWMRVTLNDNCSTPGGPYLDDTMTTPSAVPVFFQMASTLSECSAGGDSDADADLDADGGDGGGGGTACACSAEGPLDASGIVLFCTIAALAIVSRDRRPRR